MNIDDWPGFIRRKNSNCHISATGHPIPLLFGSRVGYSGSPDPMVTWPRTSRDPKGWKSWPQSLWGSISITVVTMDHTDREPFVVTFSECFKYVLRYILWATTSKTFAKIIVLSTIVHGLKIRGTVTRKLKLFPDVLIKVANPKRLKTFVLRLFTAWR